MHGNPLLFALFEDHGGTSNRLRQIRSLFNTSCGFLIIVPSLPAALEIDPALLLQDYYLLSHVVQLPSSVRDFRKGIELPTMASGSLHLSETHVTPKRGFQSSAPAKIRHAFPWNPSVEYISLERLFFLVEIEDLLIPPETPRRFFRPLTAAQSAEPEEKRDLEQIIGHKKGQRARISAILGPLLLGFKVTEHKDAASLGLAFRSTVASATQQISAIVGYSPDIEDATQEYFEYQTQSAILEQLKTFNVQAYDKLVLSKMQHELQYLDMCQVGLPQDNHAYYNLVSEVASQLGELEAFHTVQDTIKVVTECTEQLASNNSSADSLIGLLLLTVISCPYKFTDITPVFIRHFCKESINPDAGRLGYLLLTFESVFIHLRQEFPRLRSLSVANEQFWAALLERNHEGMIEAVKVDPSVAKSGPQGVDALFYASKQKDMDLLRFLLQTFSSIFTADYIYNDRDKDGETLLICAIGHYNRPATDLFLELITDQFSEDRQRQYFQKVDNEGRSIAHMLYHNDTLIAKIGHLVDWSKRDKSGMTPLLTLSGCYDHADYDGMVSLAISKWHQQHKINASIRQHVDKKGDTLLHILNTQSPTIISKLASSFDWDVNIINVKGRTPIMVAAKYDRSEFVQQLLEQGATLWQVDSGGMSVFDYAKGNSLKAMYDVMVNRSCLGVDVRALRATVTNNHCLITLSHSNGKTIHRSSAEFTALCNCLSNNYPFSWVPPVRLHPDVVLDPWKSFKCVMRKTAYNVDYFLTLLQYHETFRNCDEFLEFCYAEGPFEPEILNDHAHHWQKRQNVDGTTKYSYSDLELDQIVTFFEYSIDQLKTFRLLHTKFGLAYSRATITAFCLREQLLYEFSLINAYLGNDETSKFSICLDNCNSIVQPPNASEDPVLASVICEARSTLSLIESLEKPIEMIRSLKQAQHDLVYHRDRLFELGESKSWPVLYFEEKRTKAIQEEETAIFETRNEIRELTNSISGAHYSLATELGSYTKFRGANTMDAIKSISERYMRVSQQVGVALESLLRAHKNMCLD